MRDYPAARFVVCELGGAEWRNAQGKTPEAIAQLMDTLHGLVVQRLEAYNGRVTADRVVIVLEELEAVLDDLRLTDAKGYKATLLAVRNIARLGRKAGVHLVVATQSGKADSIDTSIRNNLRLRFLLRSVATVSRSLDCGHDLTQLGRGVAWVNSYDAMVQFPYAEQPRLPLWFVPAVVPAVVPAEQPEQLAEQLFKRVEQQEQPTEQTADMDVLAALAVLEQPPAVDILRLMLAGIRRGDSTNQIYTAVGGNRQRVYTQVNTLREALGGVQ
jgi:hypothetical protein